MSSWAEVASELEAAVGIDLRMPQRSNGLGQVTSFAIEADSRRIVFVADRTWSIPATAGRAGREGAAICVYPVGPDGDDVVALTGMALHGRLYEAVGPELDAALALFVRRHGWEHEGAVLSGSDMRTGRTPLRMYILVPELAFFENNEDGVDLRVPETTSPGWRVHTPQAAVSNGDDQRKRVAGILEEIRVEVARQDAKWKEQNHPDLPIGIERGPGVALFFGMPTDDEARVACDEAHRAGTGTWAHIMVEEFAEALCTLTDEELRAELIQNAAVALQWVGSMDRRRERDAA